MTYVYKCATCNATVEIEKSITDTIPSTVPCTKCENGVAARDWKASIIVPDHFKATSETCGGDSYANLDNLKRTFSKGKRPSGRDKIYW